MTNNKAVLIILDGWGIGDGTKSDAIANAKTPFYNSLIINQPKQFYFSCKLVVKLDQNVQWHT